MTIDEALYIIKSDNEHNKSIGCNVDFEEQLVEWLEELKSYRSVGVPLLQYFHDDDIRNDAIDDFVELVKKYDWNIRNRNENLFIYNAIDKLAEQLKEHK